MLRSKQKFVVALVVLVIYLGVLVGEGYADDFTVRLIINPRKTDVYLGSDPIALTARAKGKNLTYEWKLTGPGELEGEGSSVFYILPEKIDGKSAQALLTVTVKDESGQEITESVTFNILPSPTETPESAPAPTGEPKSKGLSKGTMIGLGVGAAAALGGGIALAAGGGGDGDGDGDGGGGMFSGRYVQQTSDANATYTRILTLSQSGNTVTGAYQVILEYRGCCTMSFTVSVTGTVQGNTGTLSWGPGVDECGCATDYYWLEEEGGTFPVTAVNDGATLLVDYGDFTADFIRQ